METLRKILEQASRKGMAIGHFNVSDLVALKAVFDVARDLELPVIVGVSEGERQFQCKDLANAHDGTTKKRLDIERIRAIKAEAQIFMTLHGASGTEDNDLREAIAAGITVVHINTEVRLAWRRGLDSALARDPNEIAPYKLLPQVVDSVKQVVAARLALFSEGQRASLATV